MTITLEAGMLAYIDAAVGLVPCKVRVITKEKIFVQVTARRPGYPLGSSYDAWHVGGLSSVVPREAVKRFRGKPNFSILPFTVKVCP